MSEATATTRNRKPAATIALVRFQVSVFDTQPLAAG
jgi:hypothetical protein